MSLESLTRSALRQARNSGLPITVTLERDLQLRVKADPDRVALLRPKGSPSEAEAYAVAAALGWTDPVLSTLPVPGRPPGLTVQPSDPDDDGVDLDEEEDTPPWAEAVSAPIWPTGLPERFQPLYTAAQAGTLPKGAVRLKHGLVTNLAGYVLAWAAGWPKDAEHLTWRLDEALEAV